MRPAEDDLGPDDGFFNSPGRLLFQMGGKGNATEIAQIMERMIHEQRWERYFGGFQFPYAFCSPDEYGPWLCGAGFAVKRVELIVKDMKQKGREGLAGWVRTTWLPYTERIPEELREEFVSTAVNEYLDSQGLDGEGCAHVKMVRLEAEATKA